MSQHFVVLVISLIHALDHLRYADLGFLFALDVTYGLFKLLMDTRLDLSVSLLVSGRRVWTIILATGSCDPCLR